MKFLANENFPLASVEFIEDNGHDIIHIGRDYAGIRDIEVMNIAIENSRTILTFDRDYGELIFKYSYFPPEGVIYLRLNNYSPYKPAEIIINLLDSQSFNPNHKLTVISESGIRQRKY